MNLKGEKMNPLARNKELVLQEAGDELMVYDLKTNKAICLNQTSAFIWQNCDGNRDVPQLVKLIKKEFGSSVDEDFVWLAISQLKKENLIDNDVPDKFDGMSRREVIKRVGLGSLVALPIIASLTAPTAFAAASVCNVGNPCTCTLTGRQADGGDCNNTDATRAASGCNTVGGCFCMAGDQGNAINPGKCVGTPNSV
ncbi:MAG: PqqD family protein [Aridibacter sp.]